MTDNLKKVFIEDSEDLLKRSKAYKKVIDVKQRVTLANGSLSTW